MPFGGYVANASPKSNLHPHPLNQELTLIGESRGDNYDRDSASMTVIMYGFIDDKTACCSINTSASLG